MERAVFSRMVMKREEAWACSGGPGTVEDDVPILNLVPRESQPSVTLGKNVACSPCFLPP